MANHYRHEPTTRRDRAIEAILEWLTTLIELWTEFWHGTEPHDHSQGASPRSAEELHAIEPLSVHHHLTAESGRYALLGPDDLLCGTDYASPAELTTIDGWTLTGSLIDSLPGA